MDFLKDFDKQIDKMDSVTSESGPPKYWFSSGNYVLNKIVSGSFEKCVPQGRVLGLAGSSGSGKSFIASNLIRSAQEDGAFNLVIDSENALDDDFLGKIGVDTEKDYKYLSVITIPDVTKVVSSFIKGYKKQYGEDLENAPKIHITIDSLDMLLTDTELNNYEKGNAKGDQGQRNKQLKAMLRTFVQDIKNLNVSMVVTSQVYLNQDILNGQGKWIIADAVKYSLSQIILIDKLKLKDSDKVVTGIRMKCEGYKTRFTKPFQVVTIEVPYETGMDKLSGLLEIAIDQGIVKQAGAWLTLNETGEKFQRKTFDQFYEKVLELLNKDDDAFFKVESMGDDEEDNSDIKSADELRKEKYLK